MNGLKLLSVILATIVVVLCFVSELFDIDDMSIYKIIALVFISGVVVTAIVRIFGNGEQK